MVDKVGSNPDQNKPKKIKLVYITTSLSTREFEWRDTHFLWSDVSKLACQSSIKRRSSLRNVT